MRRTTSRYHFSIGSLIVGLLCIGIMPAAAEQITTGTLVEDMVDLYRLGDFPVPAYKTIQFSSYDHTSTLPGGPNWFANSDGFGNEPVPNFEEVLELPQGDQPGRYVICDVEGPGAIVRTWTAAIEGKVQLFLDGQDEPIYDGSAQEFMLQPWMTYYESQGVSPDLFANTFAQRNAGYFPIPFAKRCRMIWIGNHKRIHFYQVQIRMYDKDANVTTFKPSDLKTYKKEIERAAGILEDPQGQWNYVSDAKALPLKATVAGGQQAELYKTDKGGAIERLTLKVKADDLQRALRQTILHIYFDNYPWAQVECPVGDFFGSAPGINPYDQVPFTVEPDGTMTCRFVMPFESSCRIVLDNRGQQQVAVTGSLLPAPYEWKKDSTMHFRARWRVDHDLVASGGDAAQDLPFLIAAGKGVYVGTTSMLMNPNNVPSPGGNWWGEGDEKIFVDDDFRPSTFGTGSEDYYNYAWSSHDIWISPYCGQPRNDGPANRGFVTNQRWHVLDPLPFQSRLDFYMELYHHERTPGVAYARVGYHYALPGLMDDHVAITDEDVRHIELPANWQPVSRGAAYNSKFYPPEELMIGSADSRTVKDNLYAGGELFVWEPKKEGQEIKFRIPIEEKWKYRVHLVWSLTPDSGTVSVWLDGKKLMGGDDAIVNLYKPHRSVLRQVTGELYELDKGEHTLTIRYEGPADGAPDDANDIGIDFIWVQKR